MNDFEKDKIEYALLKRDGRYMVNVSPLARNGTKNPYLFRLA